MTLKNYLLRTRKIFTYAPFETVLLFLLKGSKYQGTAFKIIPPPEMYAPGRRRIVRRDGITFELDTSCLMQWFVFWHLRDATRTRLYSLTKSGDVVFDIGTNIGETLLHFAMLVGDEGLVYGFEPDPANYADMQKNISLNRFENIRVFDLGISDKTDLTKLYRVDQHNRGMNRILNASEADGFDDFSIIKTTTVDQIVEDNNIERLDLIKIDIEGYEMHALTGAAKSLSRFHPTLFVEVGYDRLIKHGTDPNTLVKYLKDFGYIIRHAETDELIDIDYDFSSYGEGGFDIYAIVEDRIRM